MDFNYLYFRQQIETMRAARADTLSARSAHRRMAHEYVRLIDAKRARRVDAALALADAA